MLVIFVNITTTLKYGRFLKINAYTIITVAIVKKKT